ncbi:MAG TPA: TonB-dependent receptor [Spirochaetota bacterium]|nr:TonB-dependent receptor [Spirochaetota bacterium]HRZ28080.1 TonB-dependent receptor [Spirochaetota bacterium]
MFIKKIKTATCIICLLPVCGLASAAPTDTSVPRDPAGGYSPVMEQKSILPDDNTEEGSQPYEGPGDPANDNHNNEIIIKGAGLSDVEKIKSSPSSTDVIEIDSAGQGMPSMTDMLSERVGLQAKRFGGLGGFSTLSIRGSESGQVAYYLDGMPLNDARSGEVNLENLPLENLERIEVYRGFTPARFGASGIGGAVNLVTKKSSDYAASLISGSYGSFNTGKLALSHSRKIRAFDYMLCFNRTSSDGNFTFTDDRGTTENSADDRPARRRNNDHQSYAATFKGGFENDRLRIGIMDDFFYKEQGLPGANSNIIRGIRLETVRNIANVDIQLNDIIYSALSADIKCYYSMNRDAYDNPESEDVIQANVRSQKGHRDSVGADMLWELALPRAFQNITLLASYQYEMYRSGEKSGDAGSKTEWSPLRQRHRAAIAIEDEIAVLHNRLRIVPQIRYEYWDQIFAASGDHEGFIGTSGGEDREYHHVGAQLGIRYNPWDGLYLRGSAGRGFRAPTFTELFGDRGSIVGNPSLKPERSVNVEAGVGYDREINLSVLDGISAEYVFFYTLVDDRIIMINIPQSMKAQNIDRAEIMGHEISLSMGLFGHLELGVNYTNLRAIDRGKLPYYRNKYLPHCPVNEVAFSAKVKSKYIACAYGLGYSSGNFRDRYNSAQLYIRRRLIHNMTVQIFPCKELVLTLDVKNMDDNRVRDVVGYPLPGISCYGTVAVRF